MVIMFLILPSGRCLLLSDMGTGGRVPTTENRECRALATRESNPGNAQVFYLNRKTTSNVWATLVRLLLSDFVSTHGR